MKMQVSVLVTSLVLLSVGCSGYRHADGVIDTQADGIIGGQLMTEKIQGSKWVVSVETEVVDDVTGESDISGCSGSMITEDIVLTAAHCVKKRGKMSVVFSPMAESAHALRINVKKYLAHSKYTEENFINWKMMKEDIALLKLERKKPKSYEILNLTTDFPRIKKSFPFFSIGYGYNNAEVLGYAYGAQSTGVSFDPNLNYFIADQRNAKGICPGDSGGPAIVSKEKRHYVIGVAQAVFKYNGDLQNAPGIEKCKQHAIYTNVQYYRQWILDGIKSLNR
jgi:secreted trypsin-like serine protease